MRGYRLMTPKGIMTMMTSKKWTTTMTMMAVDTSHMEGDGYDAEDDADYHVDVQSWSYHLIVATKRLRH
jgi:hypothetical protein